MSEMSLAGLMANLRLDDGRPLPWPELDLPPYAAMGFGEWALRCNGSTVIYGYFRGLQATAPVWVLKRNGRVWMSTSPMELESNAPHVAAMEGRSVIMGLGMGLVVYNALKRGKVRELIVVERDKAVIRLFERMSHGWPNIDRLTIVHADAFAWQPSGPVDFLYVDIWPHLLGGNAMPDTRRIQERVQARRVGFWGIELDIVLWLSHTKQKPKLTLGAFVGYVKESGLPVEWLWSSRWAVMAIEAGYVAIAQREWPIK